MNVSARSATVPVLVIAIIIQAFLLVNGNLLFGAAWVQYQNVLIVYILLDTLFLGLAFTRTLPYLEIDVFNAILVFIPVFLVSAFAFSALFRLSPITITLPNVVLDFVFQIFVVAFTEELLFRGLLLQYNLGPVPGWFWQGIAFGLFHITSYSGPSGINWGAIVIAMILGIIFGLI
ncbi:MAG: CPBP family glutamic-type intramembrane protease, partial [Candidatus Micrarchaeaceae archaeon]